MNAWAAFRPNGEMVEWIGARPARADVINEAVLGCMAASDYDNYLNNSDRWGHCYRRGYRIKRVRIVPIERESRDE